MFTFIESSVFEAIRSVYLDDDEFAELQQFMMRNPESGQIVSGSGGVRKLRWKRPCLRLACGAGRCLGIENHLPTSRHAAG